MQLRIADDIVHTIGALHQLSRVIARLRNARWSRLGTRWKARTRFLRDVDRLRR